MDPHAQLALVIVAGLLAFAGLFRPEVRKKLGDLRALTFPGGSADLTGGEAAAQIEAQKQAPEAEKLPVPAPELGAVLPDLPPPSGVYGPIEADLRRRIEMIAPGSLDAQMAWAVRVAVAAQVERDHEATYRLIFGSQIAALKELNVRGILTIAQAKEVYNLTAVRNYPDVFKPETFEAWGDYLLTRGLVAVERQPVDDDTKAILTPLGKDFLMFVTGRGLTEHKWG
ncbi:hypothetical protein [Methylobacterium frigidaeris]|uniref:Uncharacterized protein n=1 Tax=Methylobacterium frigidaeris TaxID=2038277 RepID=A0AA37HIH7_9HYPH|nr:hypothetical protein [Methylobacterium frigidaeris]GJD65790.1 hypothetical protein MPEAHAMD_5986 [Methylobacterium frigidaeris]